jgi:hypothetical protein
MWPTNKFSLRPMQDWKDSVRLPGPKYIRALGGSSVGVRAARPGGTIVIILHELGEAAVVALKEALEEGVRTDADVYVLLVLAQGEDPAPPELLLLSMEMGDQLSTLVLRLGAGGLPGAVKVVVYWGSPGDVLRFVADAIRPDVTIVHGEDAAGAGPRSPRQPAQLLRTEADEAVPRSARARRKTAFLN